MRFEIKDYDITFRKDDNSAIVSKDGEKVMCVDFDENAGLYDIVSGVAICMAGTRLLSEDDITDILDNCGISVEKAREYIQGFREAELLRQPMS